MPGETRFIASLVPLGFTYERTRARGSISLVLSERTLAVSYRAGLLREGVTVTVNRRDISSANSNDGMAGFSCAIETLPGRRFTVLLQSEEDRRQLLTWAVPDPPGKR